MYTFWNWWQHIPEKIDPVIFQIGNFKLQYYGLMYVVAFFITYFMVLYRIKREDRFEISTEQVQSLTTWMMLGVILGGRLGYVLFYHPAYYLKHPLEIILPFNFSNGFNFTGITGMSFHGGLACVTLFTWLYARKHKISFHDITDLYVPVIPLGYTFGRLGNFINGELYGRVTDASFGMYFPLDPESALRHPSQLYEAFFEGIFLFGILWILRKKIPIRGAMLALYLIGYGMVRFFIEFVREPDSHLGYVFLFLSMGQILCMAMILAGILFYVFLWRKQSGSDPEDSS